jgi:hypothetical protein
MGLEAIPSKKLKSNQNGGQNANSVKHTPRDNILRLGQAQLLETSHSYWSDPCTNQNDRKAFVDGLQVPYHNILIEFVQSADACVDQTNYFEHVNQKWRWTVILATGAVAIINILAANVVTGQTGPTTKPAMVLSVGAAIAAAILAVLANLENFTGAQRRAQGFRQARERFLDASREYEQLWNTYVNPFYPRAESCTNAIILMRMLVEKDRELRDRLLELTKLKGQEP